MAVKKKSGNKPVVEKKINDKKDNKDEKEYKPVFKFPIVIKKVKRVEANYYGIKQLLKNNFHIDLFKKINKNKKQFPSIEEMDKAILLHFPKFYTWWNDNINKKSEQIEDEIKTGF